MTAIDYQLLAREPYYARGIPHSEMAFILDIVRELDIEVFLESGRRNGQSTYILAKYLPDVKILSVEWMYRENEENAVRDKLSKFPNVTLFFGDGRHVLPRFCQQFPKKRVAVLCDGPKGEAAVATLAECFKYPCVKVGFIHDMFPIDHGGPSEKRKAAVEMFMNYRFSDDPAYVTERSWMDAPVVAANGPVGPQWMAKYGSYGPTVGAFFNSTAISNQ